MAVIAPAMFVHLLGADAALLPRVPALTDAFYELLVANHERLVR